MAPRFTRATGKPALNLGTTIALSSGGANTFTFAIQESIQGSIFSREKA